MREGYGCARCRDILAVGVMEARGVSNTVAFDRRQIYRPFLERLGPIGSPRTLEEHDWIVPPKHDPRDFTQPPIHEVFADSAELTRGMQMALVGGTGSGKTTELLLTHRLLGRHADAVNEYLDLAEVTDLNEANPGAILAAIGMRLYARLKKAQKQKVSSAHEKLQVLAFGKTEWWRDPPDYDDGDSGFRVDIPGVMKRRFPALRREVQEVRGLLLEIASPLLRRDAQITTLIDGLDRLIMPERFRQFAEQDLRALRGTQISAVVAAPLLLWYDKSQFLADHFDLVRHLPAVLFDPEESDFLKSVLLRRGATELMDEPEVTEICRFSGGVLRDLLTLTQSAATSAYREDEDRIGRDHVRTAVLQLGRRYWIGLGSQIGPIRRLINKKEFSPDNPAARELLVNRQVLEYCRRGRDFFAVHPALAEVLAETV